MARAEHRAKRIKHMTSPFESTCQDIEAYGRATTLRVTELEVTHVR
jgi:hypothetical protein